MHIIWFNLYPQILEHRSTIVLIYRSEVLCQTVYKTYDFGIPNQPLQAEEKR